MASGVNWSYLKGMPVFIGVVNRLERVITITCGFPRANFTYKNASAPAPPDLLTTRKFWEAMLFFWRTAEMKRAIRSAPPPVPAGTTNSTGFVGCHAGAPAAGKADSTVMPRPAVKIHLSHLLTFCTPSALTSSSRQEQFGPAPARRAEESRPVHHRQRSPATPAAGPSPAPSRRE